MQGRIKDAVEWRLDGWVWRMIELILVIFVHGLNCKWEILVFG